MSKKIDEEPEHPPVKDVDGRRYVSDSRGGWAPEDDPDAVHMTWRALTQQVPEGELHVDHDDD